MLILDEPTSGLDPVVRNEALELLQDIVAKEQTSVFFSSHITEDILKIADYVTYINNGKVLLSDRKKNLLEKYKKVSFSEEVPEHIRHQLPLYRNKTAIVGAGNGLEYIEAMGLQESQLEYAPASLDEILLMLIEENTSNVEVNN